MKKPNGQREKRSIFRALFVPLFLIMILQAVIFYFAAVYGGIGKLLTQNAADIFSERLTSRKNELETQFNNRWTDLDACIGELEALYAAYARAYGADPLSGDAGRQISFLSDASSGLIDTLRHNEVNGIFLILNDAALPQTPADGETVQRYGLGIRDMDAQGSYTGREDLLLERSPSAIIDALGCSLDSWWEAKYSFADKADGDFYFRPLEAARGDPNADARDLAYLSGLHHVSRSDQAMISWSVPLTDADGCPWAVLGVEVSEKQLISLLPEAELGETGRCAYVLAMELPGMDGCTPVVSSGALYSRCLAGSPSISTARRTSTGGFSLTGRDGTALYGASAGFNIYNNNSPFEARRLLLLAFSEEAALFGYIDRVKLLLLIVAALSLVIGVVGILLVSRGFASPITALAKRVRGMTPQSGFRLERLGISEIDQLVDSIEELNRNVSRSSARTEFFSRMSHDMRTPMNAIISFSSPTLLEGTDEATKDNYLAKIHSSGEYLLALINDVLDMTKIESNKTELHLEPARTDELFATTAAVIEKLAREKGVAFTSELRAEAGDYVAVDAQHLNQIVMNLLSNAVKFTPAGGAVNFAADLAGGDAEQVDCRISVADTGIGMSKAFMERLYSPFEQEHGDREGTGLGLSIAKKLVELMGGSISCESAPGEGTAFTVALPLARCAAPEARQDEAAQSADHAVLQGRRLLVCEDNRINTEIIVNLLARAGIETATAADGAEGVAAFEASPEGYFDAVLMDIRMPVMDGLAATRAIRALPRPDARTVPILAMTANAFREDEQASMLAGMNAHLAKPVVPQKLFDTLAQLIGKRK